MQATGKAKTVIWRWQERFHEEGAAGLWRDKTRRSRIPPLSPEVAKRVIALTLAGPPPAASHWSGSAMAKAAGISVSSVQRIWRAHGLQPHRVRQFKLSNDPQFAAKLHEIVGLYVDPPGRSHGAHDQGAPSKGDGENASPIHGGIGISGRAGRRCVGCRTTGLGHNLA